VTTKKLDPSRMNSLVVGNLRFQQGHFHEERETFVELVKGQEPRALYIGCSDSRVVANFILDAGPGEVFVVRNVGAVVPRPEDPAADSVVSAIEYAIFHLKVRHVVVCAHDHCGALEAIAHGVDPATPVGSWLHRAAKSLPAHVLAQVATIPAGNLAELFVRAQFVNLTMHEVTQKALRERRVQLHAWVYDPETGRVRVMGDDGKFGVVVAERLPTRVSA
jgi:carbonic anhydrase